MLKLSLGISLALFVVVVAGLVLWGGSAEAASVCALTNSAGTNWTTANWSCIPAQTYPGQSAGDTASVGSVGTFTMTIDTVIPNSVVLNEIGFGMSVAIPSGSGLTLEPSSTISSGGDVININGGNLTINGPGTLNSLAPINLNSGSLTLIGGLSFLGASFLPAGGTINGTGTLSMPAGSVTMAGSGPLTISGAVVDNFGTITFGAAANPLAINSGGHLFIESGGSLSLTGDAAINSDGVGGAALDIVPGATMIKSAGTSNVISAAVNNDGTISLPSATGFSLTFAGGGTQTGTFAGGVPGNQFFFSGGTHIFQNPSTFSGGADVIVGGGTFQVNEVLNITGNLFGNGGLITFDPTTARAIALSGNYSQAAAGSLKVKLNGATPGTFDQIRATGTAALGGTLTAVLGYPPTVGDTYPIILDSSVSGDFGATNLPIIFTTGSIQEIPKPPSGTQVTLQAAPQADVSITKTGPASVLDGQNAAFTVVVLNTGPSTATNVIVTDTFTGGTFVSATATGGGSCVGVSSPITCTWPSIPIGTSQTATVTIKAGVAPGPINNTATATANEFDPTTPNTASAAVNINAVADVSVGPISASPGTVNAGGAIVWTIPVANAGPDTAANTTVNISVSGGSIGPLGAQPLGWSCTPTGITTASCSNPLFAVGGANLTINATAPNQSAPPYTLSANITTTASDPALANNSASGTAAVTPVADVKITKSLSSGPIAGQNATYNVTISNLGPSDATNVTFDDPAPAGLTFASTTAPCGTLPCNIGTVPSGTSQSFSVMFGVPSSASGNVTNQATVSASETDPNLLNNNSGPITNAVVQKADISVTKTGPTGAVPGSNITFTITVKNIGPSDASTVTVSDPTPARLTLVSASPCQAAFIAATPCALAASLAPNQTKTITVTYQVQPGPAATVVNKATGGTATPDPNSANDIGSATVSIGTCPVTPSNQQPADGATNQQPNGVLIWSDAGAVSYNVYLGPAGQGCNTLLATVKTPAYLYSGLQAGTTYEWRIEAVTPGCTVRSSSCIKFTTGGSSCPSTPPTLISPVSGTVTGQTTFTWSSVAGAKDYKLIVNGNLLTTTTSTSFGPTPVPNGPVTWSVIAEFDPPCASLSSTNGSYNSCDASNSKTIPSIVAQSDAGQSYTLSWDSVPGATKYEVDEANDLAFSSNLKTLTANSNSLGFQHNVIVPTAFFYRVRAFIACANAFGPNSVSVRIVLSPATAPANPNVGAPSGSTTLVPIVVHINGFPDGTFPFTASPDPQEPWLKRVEPSTGNLPPDGINLTVFADPTGLPAGTHTGTVIVLVTTPSAKIGINGVTPVNAPVSVSLVTPVTPKPSGPPPANALIIPSTGHLDGINSRWASDVRILNESTQTIHYQITFTPDDTSQSVKQTVIETAPGTTTALDDVVKTWYGVGVLGESSNGSLEIRPLDNPAKTGDNDTTPSISFTTAASSRTYNAAPNSAAGTLGEFIPAIPFQNFVGKALQNAPAQILSLQQIAQNDAMRTNFGVMEASGQPASVLVSVFDSSGKQLLQVPIGLLGGQHAQLNGFLAQNHINLNDGRITAQVVNGDGKITAYASVIDNKSGDPILVSGVPVGQNAFDHFVLPGVADINTPIAAWRTDMRIFNPTSSPQTATLTFYPVNGQGQPQSTSMTISAGEVKQLDNTLSSVFGLSNTGGAIHVQTATAVPFVISARTYNLTPNGTFGQLTTAVTAADAIGKNERPLQILQTEDSVRSRTNVGVFEVTGKPATVEVTVFLPDSKIAPSTQIPLPANGFVQIPVIQSFGLSNVYNARISLRVVDGDGRISAYGSVIDQVTQDPTFIQAQH